MSQAPLSFVAHDPSAPYDGAPPPITGEECLHRHDLVVVSAAAWRTLLDSREDLAGEPLIAGWVDRGWPLVVRRFLPGEEPGLPLGLPLPPAHGKRRIALTLPRDALAARASPPLLRQAMGVAPAAWQPTLERLLALDVEIRIYGSLAWQFLTGLDYLTAHSDLDMLLPMPRAADAARLITALGAIEQAASMRLDGELVRSDGAGVNWREFQEGAAEVLVKTTDGALLLAARQFLDGARA